MSKKTQKNQKWWKGLHFTKLGVWGTPHKLHCQLPALPVQLATTKGWVWALLSSINSFHAVHDLGSSYQEKFGSHLLLEQQCLHAIRSEQLEHTTTAVWSWYQSILDSICHTHWHTKCASGARGNSPLFHRLIFRTLESAYPYNVKQSPLATSLIQPVKKSCLLQTLTLCGWWAPDWV